MGWVRTARTRRKTIDDRGCPVIVCSVPLTGVAAARLAKLSPFVTPRVGTSPVVRGRLSLREQQLLSYFSFGGSETRTGTTLYASRARRRSS